MTCKPGGVVRSEAQAGGAKCCMDGVSGRQTRRACQPRLLLHTRGHNHCWSSLLHGRWCMQAAAGVKAEVAELHAANQALNKTYSSLHAEVKGLKGQANALADQAQAEKFALMNAQQEHERLQDQIVQVRLAAGAMALARAACCLQ